ncbi:MAG TPA: glycosyltransferase family 1 protein [Dehalococcoidia bacterium]|nr:glycosyltransferase family 1 protein [Dehalococcoidia bacterium]
MRICLLSYRSYRYSGGQGVYLRYLSRSLRDLGHSVDVVSGPPYPELDDGIRLIKVPSLDLYSMSSLRRLFIDPRKLDSAASLVEWLGTISGYFSEPIAFGMRAYNLLHNSGRNARYDIIHDNQTLAYGILKIQELGFPVVETIHHPMTVDRELAIKAATSLKNKLGVRRWYSFINMQVKVARRISHIIAVSHTARQHIATTFGIPPHRLRVIYNGIDTEIFSPSPTLNRLDNRLLVITSGNTAVKGLAYLLEALAQLRQEHNLELVVVGKGADNDMIRKLIGRLHISNYVKFIGEIDTTELVNQYRLASIAVVPSTYEGFGLPAAEAMACGAPIVATTAGALPEVVGNAGILVPPANVRALTEAISALINSPDKRKHLAELGPKRVRQMFNWQNTAKDTVDVYHETIEYRKHLHSHCTSSLSSVLS